MPIGTWDEIRTAYHVARLGTVSGAADVLGVHHATVIRHIEALERRLGVKLFQRHPRGYSPTDSGLDLLRVAGATAEQFAELEGRLHGQSAKVTGELAITSLEVMSPLLTPVLARFQAEHPQLRIKFLTDTRLFRLEYGEAHVAIRAGPPPSDDPDNVIQRLFTLRLGLYGTHAYVAQRGKLGANFDSTGHVFVGSTEDNPRAKVLAWLNDNIPGHQIVFRTSEFVAGIEAVKAGVGAGFLPAFLAERDENLVPLAPILEEWDAPIWLVTHVDLHRTAKVQGVTAALKAAAKTWDST